MFGTKVLEEFDSVYSGRIKVMQSWGSKYVATGYWTQSGGIIADVWKPAIKKLHSPRHKTWLILGLATGTIAKLIPDPAKIIGVEIDPVMIAIGKKYFGLDDIPHLEIVIADARNYHPKVDFTLVDLYCQDQMPDFVYSPKFLKSLAGVVVINHLYYTKDQKDKAGRLVTILEKIFPKIKLVRSLTNLLLICR